MLSTCITLNDVSVTNGKKNLLNITTANIPCQQITAIIGANGAGKSTLLHALLGQVAACQVIGNIQLNGESLSSLVKQGKIAWVGQREHFDLPLTVLEYAILGATPNLAWYQRPNTKTVKDAKQKLADFGLMHLKDARLHSLSGGEKQRLAFVRALMQNTDILLLDEPTNHLDIKHQRFLFDYLLRSQRITPKTIIMVLHSLSYAYQYADWMLALHQGNLLVQGSPEAVMTLDNLKIMYDVVIDNVDTSQGRIFF